MYAYNIEFIKAETQYRHQLARELLRRPTGRSGADRVRALVRSLVAGRSTTRAGAAPVTGAEVLRHA